MAPGICYGRLDLPLHADAQEQTARVIGLLSGFGPATLHASPALRCRGVAEGLAAAYGSAPQFDDRLLEMDFGAWEGVAWDDVPRAALDRWAADLQGFAAPGGETGAALVARVSAFHQDLVTSGRDCVVVSHGGPLKVLRALLAGGAVDLLAPSMPIGGVEIVSSEREQAEQDAFRDQGRGAQHVAGVAADLAGGEAGEGEGYDGGDG